MIVHDVSATPGAAFVFFFFKGFLLSDLRSHVQYVILCAAVGLGTYKKDSLSHGRAVRVGASR